MRAVFFIFCILKTNIGVKDKVMVLKQWMEKEEIQDIPSEKIDTGRFVLPIDLIR